MSAAQDLSRFQSRLPKSTPEQTAREGLLREMTKRHIEMSFLEEGWDGPGSHAPSKELLLKSSELALMIVGCTYPMPRTLNVGASADGFVQYTLFGAGGQEADLWVEDASGMFSYVASHKKLENELEGKLRIAEFMRFAAWLAGESATP